MKIKITVDEKLTDIEVEIKAPTMSDEVTKIADKLSENKGQTLKAQNSLNIETTVNTSDIYRVYSAVGKVYVATKFDEFISKQRLYELEEILSEENFVRISNSEIINLSKVKVFDLSFPKTIAITMENDVITYVSRRYVNTVKPYLMPREKAEDFPLVVFEIGTFIDVVIFDDDLVETFAEMGFKPYTSDMPLWKNKQYSKRLETFYSDDFEKWISYFASLGAVFAHHKVDSPREMFYECLNKGIIETKEIYTMTFPKNMGEYKITKEKTSNPICYTCKDVKTRSTERNGKIFKEIQEYITQLLKSGNFEEVYQSGEDRVGGGDFVRVIQCKNCGKKFKLNVDMDRGIGGFWEEK